MHRTLILASESPRRRELLESAGFEFHTLSSKVSEILDKNLILEDAIRAIARQKAEAILHSIKLSEFKDYLILSADTVVVIDNEVLGKPNDAQQATHFLAKLSGRTHEVLTGLCLVDGPTGRIVQDLEKSFVTFRKLTPQEIAEYVATGEPRDKAGAYAIQGEAKKFVRRLEGSLDNVVGLPVSLVERILSANGWEVSRRPAQRS